ncbi:endolytic transglycosylase MltG [Streptomyces sp. NPDC002004]
MQTNNPRRGPLRLTRRGRILLIATGAAMVAAGVAVPLLLMPGGGDEARQPVSLVIPEGWRAGQVYEAVDKILRVPAGSTKKAASQVDLKLPRDAGKNPEGYLFPATYPVTEKSTPETLLAYMVDTANKRFGGGKVTAGAQRNSLNAYQTVTVASIVQAEAADKKDMGKVARVVYNRLEHGMPLQMDSTINYALNRNSPTTTLNDTKIDSPYNTYSRMGLPPTPIANPGDDAMRAALNPTPGNWLYFVTVKPGDTRFTADFEQQQKNVTEFNQYHQSAKPSGTPTALR